MESQFKTHPNLNGESKKDKELLGVLLESYWLIKESFRKSDQETKTIALNRIREALNEFDKVDIPENEDLKLINSVVKEIEKYKGEDGLQDTEWDNQSWEEQRG